ncbi:MAG: alanine racemase [Pseudomonadota bacterium]
MTLLNDLYTPCLLLDTEKLRRNAQRMRANVTARGLAFRPHFKTVKCVEALPLILDPAAPRLTVSTLAEAEAVLQAGVTDILYAVGIAPNKLEAVADLLERGADLCVTVDSVPAAECLSARFAGSALATRLRVMIEIDTDGHRAGLAPEDPALFAVAEALGPLPIVGVMTHAGESYLARNGEEAADFARREAEGAVRAAERLRSRDYAVPLVSVGSSPTVRFAGAVSGVTECRAGVYALGDLFMSNIGVCDPADIALSCLVTVIGHQRARNWILTDGGWTALSQDRSTAGQSTDWLYGQVCDVSGAPIEGLLVIKANQEHGILSSRDGSAVPDLPWGTRLRILPNHACAMAQHHAKIVALGPRGHETWNRVGGWAPQGRSTP